MVHLRWTVAAVLLQLASTVLAHGDDGMGDKPMEEPDYGSMPSYSGLTEYQGTMLAHVVLMVLAWFFILPIGVMFSIARSRYTLSVQFVFLILNGVGVILATVYNVNTPDLYKNNAHHKIGWIATWVMTAQVVMNLLFLYSGRTSSKKLKTSEQVAFLPVSRENMASHTMSPYHDYRWSGDSGHGTERSSTQVSRDISPTDPHRLAKPEPLPEEDDDEYEELPMPMPNHQRRSIFRIRPIDTFLSKRVPGLLSKNLLRAVEIVYEIVDRTILILGFVALTTGWVTYVGWFHGSRVFNGLAHWIKGGIFFWYGMLTLGRWMGCFADLGWAWNIKPTHSEVGQWKAKLPSAEFTESFVIWLYGSTNMFLEHLAAWGKQWTAQDLEHVSISIMFFGGGLCGMLIESKTVRNWLNTSVDMMPTRTEVHPAEAQMVRKVPRTYGYSLNPLPALIILLLGIMMSSHHQDSVVSTMVHKQWGTLFVGFSLARVVTYIMLYLSPPSSIYPGRPPSELVSSFCLIAGGLVFMGSTRDIIIYMEDKGLMAMFVLTVVCGFSTFVMAYEVVVLSLKGWAVRREMKLNPNY